MGPQLNQELRSQVIVIYKELLNLGKDYPLGQTYFRHRLHAAFAANSHLQDEHAIRQGIERARFVQKEIEALYDKCIASSFILDPHGARQASS